MHVAIVGSGPVGMTSALLLARQGHRVSLVDRDPGPVNGRDWDRVGVMQYHLPHGFRSQCRQLLAERLPDVLAALIAAGAEVAVPEGAPPTSLALRVRRSVCERVLWECATAEPGITRRTGHVDRIELEDRRAVGVVVDGSLLTADLVVDASGRNGRLSAACRPVGRRVDCGMAYAARHYRLLPGAEPGPTNGEPGYFELHRGFVVMLFRQDDCTFNVLFVRPTAARELALLRHTEAFEAACAAVPGIAEWTDPARSVPIDTVRAGAGLTNEYAPQPTIEGLVVIGDAFSLTNPQGARGMALGMLTAAKLADLVAADAELSAGLDAWGREQLLPWYHDHAAWDAAILASWAGEPVTPDGPIGLETLVSAAQERYPEWMPMLGRFFGMEILPTALEPLRDLVRDLVRAGWQPPEPTGLTRADLAALIDHALAVPVPA